MSIFVFYFVGRFYADLNFSWIGIILGPAFSNIILLFLLGYYWNSVYEIAVRL